MHGAQVMTKVHGKSFTPSRARVLREALLEWFHANKRELPWRLSRDPYRVWISEIMLQQTRVAAVVPYYERFLKTFPDIHVLAKASEADVLAVWSGLGYYRRARGLRAAAKTIVDEYSARLPRTAREWENLPGVGRYTAAAIASIAFGEHCAAVDGNVVRVLQRMSGEAPLSRSRAWEMGNELVSPEHPGDYNEAMMELGATVCVPGQPLCDACPIAQWCATRGSISRTAPGKRRRKRVTYLFCRRNRRVYLVQRETGSSVMPGMWELPVSAGNGNSRVVLNVRHSITDTDYAVTVVSGDAADGNTSGQWISIADLEQMPLTGLARKVLKRLKII